MPPPHPPKHHKPPASRALAFIDKGRIDALLAPFVTDPADRQFLLRCVLDEGPIHHRGANYVILALLGQVLEQLPGPPPIVGDERVPMRLPPHLRDALDDADFPIAIPTHALLQLAGADESRAEAMLDCLVDGPPQHALANVAMVSALQLILERLKARA